MAQSGKIKKLTFFEKLLFSRKLPFRMPSPSLSLALSLSPALPLYGLSQLGMVVSFSGSAPARQRRARMLFASREEGCAYILVLFSLVSNLVFLPFGFLEYHLGLVFFFFFLSFFVLVFFFLCLLYTSPSPRDQRGSRMPSSA